MPEMPKIKHARLRVANPERLWTRIGGLSVIERILFICSRAGLLSLTIEHPEPSSQLAAALRFPPGLQVKWSTSAADSTTELILSSDHFLRVDALSGILRATQTENTVYNDASGIWAARIALNPAAAGSPRVVALSTDDCLSLPASPNLDQIIDWLLFVGRKSQDGFMAKHFDRKISLFVSRRLLDTAVTPNIMTIFSTILGLVGGALFLGASTAHHVLGALFVWLHSVLDGCDGELARVRFQESPFGSDLDFWGDNLVHWVLFSSIGVGFWSAGKGVIALALAAVAVAGAMGSAWFAWQHRLQRRAGVNTGPEVGVLEETGGSGLRSRLVKLENALAQRDFIYLLIVLAWIGRLYEFLWAAALGGTAYFIVMLYLRRLNQNEQAQQPHLAR